MGVGGVRKLGKGSWAVGVALGFWGAGLRVWAGLWKGIGLVLGIGKGTVLLKGIYCRPQSWWLTQLDLVLTLCQMLEFSDDGTGCQVVKSLAPHVSVWCVSPLQGWRFQLEAHFPLHALVVAQAFDQSLAQHRAWSGRPAGIGLLL